MASSAFFRAAFLHEADDGVEHDDDEDHERVDRVAEQSGDHGRAHQHVDQHIVELQQQPHQRAARSGGR
ncbi:MAG: hypothetical protein M5U33_00755 [Pseudorhodoplanes sp.]|nr:hypothetical protein [Pseudorhodoplanes sp.]